MKYIKSFSMFLINEKLHIHDEMDSFTNYMYQQLCNKNVGIYEIKNVINDNLKIDKVIVNIITNSTSYGELDINKSYLKDDKWIFYLNLRVDFTLAVIKHEMDHALKLLLGQKDVILNKLNNIKASYVFNKNNEIENFFYMIYLSSEHEINSAITEAHGELTDYMRSINKNNLSKQEFKNLIVNTRSYKNAIKLSDFKMKENFVGFSENNLNKLLYLYEENKAELDNINKLSNFIMKIKLIIKGFKLLFNKISFDFEPDRKYTPDKNYKFYDKFINKKGVKLKRKLLSLYMHYELL